MNFKRLICRIFGHKFGDREYTVVDYRRTGNYQRGLKRTTRRNMKKKVVKEFCKCERCGAYIMFSKRRHH